MKRLQGVIFVGRCRMLINMNMTSFEEINP